MYETWLDAMSVEEIKYLSNEMVNRLVDFDGMNRVDAENLVADIRLICNEPITQEQKQNKLESLKIKYSP